MANLIDPMEAYPAVDSALNALARHINEQNDDDTPICIHVREAYHTLDKLEAELRARMDPASF